MSSTRDSWTLISRKVIPSSCIETTKACAELLSGNKNALRFLTQRRHHMTSGSRRYSLSAVDLALRHRLRRVCPFSLYFSMHYRPVSAYCQQRLLSGNYPRLKSLFPSDGFTALSAETLFLSRLHYACSGGNPSHDGPNARKTPATTWTGIILGTQG